uniref:Uncharacterized protein n=1 Tax=Avena sativa TaxID=4498 RepID=A0ACD6A557_AVESA
MCILFTVGNNGLTYFNTAALISSVENFPKNRGPIVGILKGYAGLSGAILTQIYAIVHSPDDAALLFMVAVGPAMVVISLMFIVRPVGGHVQARPSDGISFTFVHGVCLVLAAYLMGVMLLEDLVGLSQTLTFVCTIVLMVLLLVPVAIPVILSFFSNDDEVVYAALLPAASPRKEEAHAGSVPFEEEQREVLVISEERDEGRKLGPRRGEDFTLLQAIIKADFWLLFSSLLLGSGSGLTVFDNLGQMSQSLGYEETHIFVSMISIWSFLGRIAGGYFSEIAVKDYAYPRPIALVAAQVLMAIGHFTFAMAWPGTMYIGTLLIGLGYGAHWVIVPVAASELFGVKNFGTVFNFLTVATPIGSLVFSGIIASGIYDYEAKKQAHQYNPTLPDRLLGMVSDVSPALKCEGSICFFISSLIMSGFCVIAIILSLILVHRTKIVYTNLYGKPRT